MSLPWMIAISVAFLFLCWILSDLLNPAFRAFLRESARRAREGRAFTDEEWEERYDEIFKKENDR